MQFSDILVKNALFCDETEDYRTPAEPEAGDSVVIRFRTLANNVDNVYPVRGQRTADDLPHAAAPAAAG